MSSLGRNEENLDGRMEKAVLKILQTFMIHEQCGRERNGTKEAARSSDESGEENTSTRRDQNGLCLVIKVNFIIHKHKGPQSIMTSIVPQSNIPEPILKKNISHRASRTMSASIAVRLMCYPTSERIPCHASTT